MRNKRLNASGANLLGRPMVKRTSNSEVDGATPPHRLSFLRKQESTSFFKKYNWIPVFTGMTQSKLKGRLGRILYNPKGLSVLFLVIAMMVMVSIGYVLSYLIPTKQKTVSLTVSSNQAFFLAQSGVEFAVRYASDNGLSSLSIPITRNLGRGSFTISYEIAPADRLTSIGQIPNVSQRRIVVSNFTSFLPQAGLVIWTPVPCWPGGSNTNIRFSIKNVGSSAITLNRFSATWVTPPTNRNITTIILGANTVFSGTYNYPSCSPCVRNFTPVGNTQTVNPDQVIIVQVTWSSNIGPGLPVIISFYDTTGVEYQFTLQPTGNC